MSQLLRCSTELHWTHVHYMRLCSYCYMHVTLQQFSSESWSDLTPLFSADWLLEQSRSGKSQYFNQTRGADKSGPPLISYNNMPTGSLMQDWISVLSFALQMLNSMGRSPSWEQSLSYSRNFLSLTEPKHSLCVHKSLTLIPILSKINPSHRLTYLYKIHFNIIILSILKSTIWLLHFRFCDQNSVSISCYMPCSFYPPWLDHSNYTWWRVQVTKRLIMEFSPASYCFICLQSRYSPQHPVLRHPQSISFVMRGQASHPYNTK
jgi:hypothetical protein